MTTPMRCAECTCKKGGIYCNWIAHGDPQVRALLVENERMREALEPCLALLDGLVKESGRGVDWGEEDPFRMGEWFEDEDLAAIETARAALKDGK